MRTALDAPSEALDAQERKFVDSIRKHGFFHTSVPADDEGPGFSYTTGFWVNLGQPELIVFSLESETAHDVFWDCYRDLKAGKALPVGKRTPVVFANIDAWLSPVAASHFQDFLGWNRWFYDGDDFPCQQLFYPDGAGRFPWEHGCDAAVRASQPDLSERL